MLSIDLRSDIVEMEMGIVFVHSCVFCFVSSVTAVDDEEWRNLREEGKGRMISVKEMEESKAV